MRAENEKLSERLFELDHWEEAIKVEKLEAENERMKKHERDPIELAGRLYWFANEGNHVYDMDDGGTVTIKRPTLQDKEGAG